MNNIDKGLEAWELNAEFWDKEMGDHSNYFHRDLVRPHTEKLLEIKPDDLILDIACGNGNFSEYMAKIGVRVIAFDYSSKMIEFAKKRRSEVLDRVEFKVCDATEYQQLLSLKQQHSFDKAVENMVIMDISDIKPLFKAVYEMLSDNGTFVFATHHPCFTYPNKDYFTSCIDKGFAIEGQPALQNYYHRSISEILHSAFDVVFVLDSFYEVPFKNKKTPIIMVIRLCK